MKFQNQLTGFDSGMRGFNAINNLLADNWADSNMEAFKTNHLAPIATNAITSLADVQERMTSIDRDMDNISEQQTSLEQLFTRGKESQYSEIEGSLVVEFSTNEEPTGDRSVRHFLLDKRNVNKYGNDAEALEQIAYTKFPGYKDYLDFHHKETITLWGK